MKIDFAARVDIGPRETNDDRLLIDGQILDRAAHSGALELPFTAAVCDGCGGYAGGGIAAHTVLELLSLEAPEALAEPGYLGAVLENCRLAIEEQKLELPQFSAMCATVAGCIFTEESTLIFHSGDSRVYRHDQWGLARMTRDHSLVQELVDAGEITPEEALVHPRRNVITRCIGSPCRPPELYLSAAPIRPGEKYLFCSDGLWEALDDTELSEILSSAMTPKEMADAMIGRAMLQGATDNISVCICSVEGEEAPTENKPFVLD